MLNGFLAANALQANTERSITDPDRLRDALSAIRSQGYSTDDEDFMTGMAAIAVPVLDPQGRLLATISTHAPVQRHSIESLIACLPVLQKAALDLAKL
jgi:DNA-binding IclR family transcriptional regulator